MNISIPLKPESGLNGPPADQPYGERQYNAQDFHGHRWDFTETIADVAPEDWSGDEFHLD